MSYFTARPAEVADYDSDESRTVAGTEVSAKTSRRGPQETPSSKTPKHMGRLKRTTAHIVPESDSGYSSSPWKPTPALASPLKATAVKPTPAPASPPKATAVKPTPALAKTSQPAVTASSSKPKPVIHRTDSARSTRAATLSTPTTTTSTTTPAPTPPDCTDRHCCDPACESVRNKERRYTIPNRPSMPPPSQHSFDYTAMPPPPLIPRPRIEPTSRPRPQSFHAAASMPLTYSTPQPAPLPSASAFYGYSQAPPSQHHSVYGSTPPAQSAMLPPPSNVAMQLSSSSAYPGQTAKISARTGNPAVPGLANSFPVPLQTYIASATMPVRDDRRGRLAAHADDYTSSESETSDEEHRRHQRIEQGRRRESKQIEYEPSRSKSRRRYSREVIVEDPRRPTVRKHYTTSAVPARQPSRRESPLRPEMTHRTHSDPMDDHASLEKYNFDKAVGDHKLAAHRSSAMVSKHSRRPSVAFSYDTPPTSLSSGNWEAIIEDRHGRRRVYLSQDQYEALARERELEDRREGPRDRFEDQRLQQERIERYQHDMSAGLERQDLTATSIKEAHHPSLSHLSCRSQKTMTSGSKISRGGGLMIESHGTVLQIEEGVQEIVLRADDSGGTRLVIGSSNGHESSYHGNKASGSRVERSRTPHHEPNEPIHEEGGYEKAY